MWKLDGVELRRVGQAGVLGRYPLHWHGLSYTEAGETLGDVTGHFVRNSSIHNSSNRCVTIHGTNGIVFENNICFDILGHAVFFEDGVEERNIVDGNLVLGVRVPTVQNALKPHDIGEPIGSRGGASGLWATNPNNTITNNVFADSAGFGMWLSFARRPVGLFADVPVQPFRTTFGNFDGNVMHSNNRNGVMFDFVEVDEDARLETLQYASTTDGQDISWPYENLRRFEINNWVLWKNGNGNFWNRVALPTYRGFVSADGEGKYFAGSGGGGVITRSLLIGESL